MSSTSLARALVLTSSAIALCTTFSVQTAAQQQGDVKIRSASQSVVDSLDSLEQLLLAPPEEQNRLNIYVTPQFRRERFDAYNESGQIFQDNLLQADAPLNVDSPEFETEGTGISIGADYLLDSKWLFGMQVNYTKTEFDYATPSESEVLAARFGDFNSNFLIGDPVDREIDEYGISMSAGYLADPWTGLLTFGYSRRNIETITRKVSAVFAADTSSVLQLSGLESDFNSDVYSADLGGSYRFRSGTMSLQPFASIGYQIEDVDGYTEKLASIRQRVALDNPNFFTRDPNDPTLTIFDVSSNVDGQTIRSIPGRVGVLLSTPFTSETTSDNEQSSVWKLRSGLSFTHDFSDQKRRIRSESNLSGFSIAYEEENRNRNFFSFTAALGFDFAAVNGSLGYQRDIGLDERKSADILSLQLRVPF